MKRAQAFYAKSPVWLQNLIVSAYGWQRGRRRHGGRFREHLAAFLESQWWSEQQFAEYQLDRLRLLVEHSMKHVPYFREEYTALGIRPDALTDVKQLPLLDKDILRTQLDQCVAEIWPRRKLYETHTSGSTGTPLTYFMHPDDIHERNALLERQRRWAGVKGGQRCATFGGTLLVGSGQSNGPMWRHNIFGNQIVFSSYHLSPDNLPSYVQRLAQFDPVIVEGYPSALYIVAQWMAKHGRPEQLAPRAILATAETLHGYQREVIERAFDAHVFDYYGSSEAAPMISQCKQGNLHVNPEAGIFEFLRPDGSDAAPGEVAEMVVTSFATRAMPLIRYRIRDAAIPEGAAPCPCGRHMPRVRTILGRLDDMIYTRDRGWIGRLSQAVKVFPGSIREAQIVQEDVDNVVIRLVPDAQRFHESQIEPLMVDLRSRIGHAVKIHIEYVDQIERGPNNKFKYVVNKLPAEEKRHLRLESTTEHQ